LAPFINYNNLISIRINRIHISEHYTISKYSFNCLSHLVSCSSNQFRQISKEIPTHLTYLHMYFDSINDMDQFIRPNMNQLQSLGVGIQCSVNDINQFMLIFSNYQWNRLVQLDLNFNAEYDDFEGMLMFHSLPSPRFNHVTKLSLNGCLTIDLCDAIQNHVNLGMIQHFQFSSTVGSTEVLMELINNMPNLSSIHIQYLHCLDLFNLILLANLSIRHLVLFDYESTIRKQLFYHICRVFSRLTHLTTDYYSRRALSYLLTKLVYLEQLTLRLAKDQYASNYG
ncbi:unnamed protein product, partial [Rotaria sp. Silwood1]